MDITRLTPAQHGELRAHLLAALSVVESVSAMRDIQSIIWRLAQDDPPNELQATEYVLSYLVTPESALVAMSEGMIKFNTVLDVLCEHADLGVEDDEPYGPMWLGIARHLKDARQRLQATLAKEEQTT